MKRRIPSPLIRVLNCGNFRSRAGWNGSRPGRLSSLPRATELREVCYQARAAVRLPEMFSELHASTWYDAAESGVIVPLAEGASRGRPRDGGGRGCCRLPCPGALPSPCGLGPYPGIPDPLGADPADGPGWQAGPAGPAGRQEGQEVSRAKAAIRALRAEIAVAGASSGSSWCARYRSRSSSMPGPGRYEK